MPSQINFTSTLITDKITLIVLVAKLFHLYCYCYMYIIIIYVMIILEHFFFSYTLYKDNIYFWFDYLKSAKGGHCASAHKVLTVVS